MNKQEQDAFRAGAIAALRRWGVWKDGAQHIYDHEVPWLEAEIRQWDLEGVSVEQAGVVAGCGAEVKAGRGDE